MATYQQTGSTIGNLLRAIQEEKSQSPLEVEPTAEIGSPIRDLVQEPVFQPESPDSSRIAQIRPGIEQQTELGTDGAVVPPVQPLPPQGGEVVAPVAPSVVQAPAGQISAGNPSAPAPSSRSVVPPSLATRITSVPSASVSARTPVRTGQVAGASAVKAAAPKAPTPTPTPQRNTNTQTAAKAGVGSLATSLAPTLLRNIGQTFFNKVLAAPTKLLQGVIDRYKYATSRQA